MKKLGVKSKMLSLFWRLRSKGGSLKRSLLSSTIYEDLQCYRARRHSIPGIILNTLPKSATVHISTKISNGLKIPCRFIHIGKFPDKLLVPKLTKELARGGIIAPSHFSAKGYNLATLQNSGVDRIIVHVRDPRQAMLSWIHHIIERRCRQHPDLVGIDVLPPDDYFLISLTNLITWHIENFLPIQIKWIEGWIDASEDSTWGVKILFTKYEDFKSNSDVFFDSILQHYEIERSLFTMTRDECPQPGELHFRKGRIDEWRDVFTSEQSVKATNMIPGRIWEKFNWRR